MLKDLTVSVGGKPGKAEQLSFIVRSTKKYTVKHFMKGYIIRLNHRIDIINTRFSTGFTVCIFKHGSFKLTVLSSKVKPLDSTRLTYLTDALPAHSMVEAINLIKMLSFRNNNIGFAQFL